MARVLPYPGRIRRNRNLLLNLEENEKRKKLLIVTSLLLTGVLVYQQYYNVFIIKASEQMSSEGKELQRMLKEVNVKIEELSSIVNTFMDQQMYSKTHLIDYALLSAGAEVISTRETECYTNENHHFVLLGYPVCAGTLNAQTILQPSTNPGDCWAIKGQEASAVIKLATMIEVENVSLDHIHKSLAPLGDTSSAPNKFSVWGLDSQTCDHRHLFGIFCYNNDGSAVQTFQVKNKGLRPYNIIELKVHSNHGNPKYTCIYKIRVHGKKSSSSGITVHS